MSRTWHTDEMAVNRKKIVEATQMIIMPLFEQKRSKGNPSKPEIRSESAKEVRNMLVRDFSVLFLTAKNITTPFTITISKQMKAKSTIIDGGRSAGSPSSDSAAFLDSLLPGLELLELSAAPDK